MICSKCQTANPDGAKFCMGCGAALALACPECKTELPAGAQFCFNCGHRMDEAPKPGPTSEPKLEQYVPQELRSKLETARESGGMQGERRVVTMLFCDVKGSTAAAEKLDPEEWAEIMNGAFELLIAPVYHYEGTLARLLGDAILAFFGAPLAHEDDPQRAVLASLEILEAIKPFKEEMQRRWGLDFDVRLGINTGLVVVGEMGSDLRVEYTALGDAVNLAARMEQTAEPGTVQITDNTHKLIAPLFDFEDLGEAEVKGKEEPVRSYRVLGRKAEPGSLRGIEGLDSRLIGRDDELHLLRNAVDELRQGRGQIVSLMADAGLGKSRLMAEFRQGLVADGLVPAAMPEIGATLEAKPELLWHEGRSLSYQTATPYAPFIDLLGTCFGLGAEPTDAENYGKLKSQITTLLPDRAEEMAPFIATVLGINLDGDALERVKYLQPPQIREGAFRALQALFERLSAVSPMVLVLDDLHWADSTSLDLLEQLMVLTDSSMLMIVALFRPQRQEPSWRFHEVASRDFEHRYTPVSLEPLDEAGSRELVSSILHIEGLPDKVRDLILQKAEGNPFFVEEVIRSLLESGVVVPDGPYWRATRDIDNIAVPDTLSGVLTTRLDRLEEDSKHVAQSAAVIGREFQFDTLRAVVDGLVDIEEQLRDLQRRGLVREKSRVPQRVYTFKHTLTQETAYGSLLLSSRRQLHLRVAEHLEQTEADRVNDIGWHFLEGREHNRALPYLLAAGEQAAHAYATPEAIWYFKHSLDVVDEVNDVSLARRAYEGLGGALTFSFDVGGATENYDHMLAYAKAHNDTPWKCPR
jgi:class 3 adenylate cyclase